MRARAAAGIEEPAADDIEGRPAGSSRSGDDRATSRQTGSISENGGINSS